MPLDRREFIRRVAPSLSGLAALNWIRPGNATGVPHRALTPGQARDFGPLSPAPECPEIHIPAGFTCRRLSVAMGSSPSRPWFTIPNAFDGMASFALPNGNIRLIRNHEMTDRAGRGMAFAAPHYDRFGTGGTTSLEVRLTGTGDNLSVELLDEFPSLAGTRVNCAGGPTPWGSWLSCEEDTNGTSHGFQRPHGYIFEVPASATGPVDPVPLKAMGRFVHEAIAIDPASGIVYETEDTYYVPTDPRLIGAGFYRFIPNRPGVLADGGRLQIMTVPGRPNFLTARGQTAGTAIEATWVDIDDPDPVAAERDQIAVFREGLRKGAAVFARLEGAFWGDGGVYIVSTSGGDATAGQVFHYRPTSEDGGQLTLVFESPSRDVLDAPDNVCLAPGGGVILCEDSSGDQFIRKLDPRGNVANLVRNPAIDGLPGPGEFCGACFSPDNRVLFFNVQGDRTVPGNRASVTYAMWGPWEGTLRR